MAYEALRHYSQRNLTFRFVSNVDSTDFRYSMDSAIGLSTMLAIGPDNFRDMHDGFHQIDEHLKNLGKILSSFVERIDDTHANARQR